MTEATFPTPAEAIGNVINDLKGIGRDSVNEAQGYNYRGIDQLVTEVRPLLVKHGVVIVPGRREIEVVSYTMGNGRPAWHATLNASWAIYGPNGDSIYASSVGGGADTGDKAVNKASTSAYKYLLLQLFCISDPSDDADRTDPGFSDPIVVASVAPTSPSEAPEYIAPPSTPRPAPASLQAPPVDIQSAGALVASAFPNSISEAARDISIDVPYAAKDAAKAAGARWSKEGKTWYIPAGKPLAPFAAWLDDVDVPADEFIPEPEYNEDEGPF